MYKVLIVDDEFLARKLLQGYIEKMPELELVGTCANIAETYKALNEQQVDILLLDIHLPDLSGMEFARTCSKLPAVIFTTAYSEYALESYEVSAVDYLLKPIRFERFEEAIRKAMARCIQSEAPKTETSKADTAGADASKSTEQADTFLWVKADYKIYKINYDDLLYIEGQHEYVSFYTTGKRITALYALKTLEEQLPSSRFVRVHKSYIVAISQIQEMGQLSLTVAGVKIPIGGNYREALMKKLGTGSKNT